MLLRLRDVDEHSEIFNPRRLTVARKRRGLTKTELAQKIGVDWRSVSGYEAEEYPPSDETLGRIATALKFPLAFFSGEDLEELEPDIASFRALKKIPRRNAIWPWARVLWLFTSTSSLKVSSNCRKRIFRT
jgi:transcriptional regulator with XRE-family HTH domain